MKKRKNKQRKQLLKLLPIIRSIIKDLAQFYPSAISTLLLPGLASIFEDDLDLYHKPKKEYINPISYNERVRMALEPFIGKYRKIDLEKFYRRIWKEDFRNYCHYGYKFDPRGREIIQPDGHKIIRL